MLQSPDRAGEYRDRARQCLEAANQMATEEARAILLDLAFHWIKLAEQAERPEVFIRPTARPAERRH